MAGAQLEFTEFTDPNVMFSNKDEVNDFFEAIRVPLATDLAPGVMLQADALSNAFVDPVDEDTVTIDIDGVVVGVVPTAASFAELKDKFLTLQASYVTLIAKLRDAGIMKV